MTRKTRIGLRVFALLFLALFAWSCVSQGRRPAGITANGTLTPCPGRPNCVCSEDAAGSSRIEPLSFTGTPEAAWECLKGAVEGIGGRIEREDNGYLWAIFKTTLFRFVDDMEFRMEPTERIIHVRSASRIGYSDLGMNRKRVEALRQRFAQELEQRASPDLEDAGTDRATSSP